MKKGRTERALAIIQARMGSTRLPGKVLMDLEGASVLARVVKRVQRASAIEKVIVATTDLPTDDAIVAECGRLCVDVFRGEENDVLDRFYRAAQHVRAETIVRITADCPLIDPQVIDMTIQEFFDAGADYSSNALVRMYPRGLDTEVFSFRTLETAWREASEPYQRAHVTPFIYENPQRFRILRVRGHADYSEMRWTLDTEADLEFLRAIYSRLAGRDDFGWRDVLAILDREPALSKINQHVAQKALQEG